MRSCLLVLMMCACGRIGFDASTGTADASGEPDGPPGMAAYVGSFVAQTNLSGASSDTFTMAAQHAGDAMLLHVFCETGTTPAMVTIAGTSGWTWTMLTSLGSASSFRGAAFGAVAPDTASATFTVTWAIGTDTCSFIDEMGDELTSTDPTGGAMTFEDAAIGASMTGNCDTTVTTRSANAALWTACTTNCVSAPAAGFTKSSDDGHCDASAYRLTTDPANTPEAISFATTTGSTFIATSVAVRAR
jgi:hypothetical protein